MKDLEVVQMTKNMNRVVAVNEAVAGTNIIGKIVYFTIGKAMIAEDRVLEVLKECGINENIINKKHTSTQAFKTATSKLQTGAIITKDENHNVEDVFKIRIFDNKKEDNGTKIVREIKKENIHEKTNKFLYLGNFIYDKETDTMSYSLVEPNIKDLKYDIKAECDKAIAEFDIERHGFNEDRLATLLDNYMAEQLEGTRIQIHGKLWFIPMFKNEDLVKIENFMDIISQENIRFDEDKKVGRIEITSIPIMDEEKYVEKYSREFHAMAQAELEIYQKKIMELMKNESARSLTMDTWIKKAQQFIDKKQRYEELFKKDIEDMNDDLTVMNRQLRELEIRREQTKEKELANKRQRE
jgi:hypothetical protein